MNEKDNTNNVDSYFFCDICWGFSSFIALPFSIMACGRAGGEYVFPFQCEQMSIEERFSRGCTEGITFNNGRRFSCQEIADMGLQEPFLDGASFRVHGDRLYVVGTEEDVIAGKESGDYCLEAPDTWQHIGEHRGVVFRYESIACSNGYCFINEKKDYKNGFVVFFSWYNLYSWDEFRTAWGDNRDPILLCGDIVSYEGHPEIKVMSGAGITRNPNESYSGSYRVYRYICH